MNCTLSMVTRGPLKKLGITRSVLDKELKKIARENAQFSILS